MAAFSKIWNVIVIFGLAAAAYGYFTGKDISGTPTSMNSMSCKFIADYFKGQPIEVDYQLVEIKEIRDQEEQSRAPNSLICTGLAFLTGRPSTLIRLSATGSSDNYNLEVSQALPQDYDCETLSQEIIRKFSQEVFSFGKIVSISNMKRVDKGTSKITCVGAGSIGSNETIPVTFSYDGQYFQIEQV